MIVRVICVLCAISLNHTQAHPVRVHAARADSDTRHPRTKGTRVDTPTASPSTLHTCVNVVTLSTVTREEALSRQTRRLRRETESRDTLQYMQTVLHTRYPSNYSVVNVLAQAAIQALQMLACYAKGSGAP